MKKLCLKNYWYLKKNGVELILKRLKNDIHKKLLN